MIPTYKRPSSTHLWTYVFIFILINHYSYSDYLVYDERPHPTRMSEGVVKPLSRSLLPPALLSTYITKKKGKNYEIIPGNPLLLYTTPCLAGILLCFSLCHLPQGHIFSGVLHSESPHTRINLLRSSQ